MKNVHKLLVLLLIVSFIVSCGATATPEPEPTKPEVVPTEPVEPQPTEVEVVEPPPAGLACEEPIKIGLITDKSGALALYGEMIERSFLLGMEYMAGAPGTEDNTFTVDNCDIQILIRDDQSNPETTSGAGTDRGR